MEFVVFVVFGALVLVGAFGVVLARNPVHSALFLVTTLVAIAVLFLMQDAALLAAIQIVVYAGAIVVLFLFVIMLLGVDRSDQLDDPRRLQRVVAPILGGILLVQVVVLAGRNWVTGAPAPAGSPRALDDPETGNVERLAEVLFTDFFWPFQVTAAMLVVAVVGAVVLARRSRTVGTTDPVAGTPSGSETGAAPTGEPGDA